MQTQPALDTSGTKAEVVLDAKWIKDPPTCELDHCYNLAVYCARMPVDIVEQNFLTRWRVDHEHFVKLLNKRAFWKRLRAELVALKLMSRYANIVEAMATKAEAGSVHAAEMVLSELRINTDDKKKSQQTNQLSKEDVLRELGRTIGEALTSKPASVH